MTLTDRELLAQAAAGDRAAFEAFAARHQGGVLMYLRTLTRSALVEDALQETLLAAWRGAGSFQGAGSARAWLLTIARRALFRELQAPAWSQQDTVSLEALGRVAGWGAEPAIDPRESLLERDRVRRALAALSEADREALVLRDGEGLSNQEAADVTGLDLAAFKSRLLRARLRFTAAYGGPDAH